MLTQVEGEVAELRRRCKARENDLMKENTALAELTERLEKQLAACTESFAEQSAAAARQIEQLQSALQHGRGELTRAQQQVARAEAELREVLATAEARKAAQAQQLQQLMSMMSG